MKSNKFIYNRKSHFNENIKNSIRSANGLYVNQL